MKYNDNGGRFTAEYCEALHIYYMAESVAGGHADYFDYFEITKADFDRFEDPDFSPAGLHKLSTCIYNGHRFAHNTPEQEEKIRIIRAEEEARRKKQYGGNP